MKPTDGERLPWDSELFGFPVARVAPGVSASALPGAISRRWEQGIRLAYWTLDRPDETRSSAALALKASLVDEKTTFVGAAAGVVAATASAPRDVVEYVGDGAALRPLALAAGVFSRFRVDPKMQPHHFEQLYLAWLERSVRKEIASAVFVTGTRESATGFVTVGVKEHRTDIGLIAVDARARGHGCGKALVGRAAQWSLAAGIDTIQVVTQGSNSEACALYARCGLAVESINPVFHFWLESVPPR